MDTQYYYIRLPSYDEVNQRPGRSSWVPCTKARAEKRFKAACETESFNNYVAIVTENETEITVQEAFENDGNRGNYWKSLIILKVRKEHVFGSQDKTFRDRFALSIFEDAMDTCVSEQMAC